jgi:hypothetical protein
MGVLMECSAAPGFAELVIADVVAMVALMAVNLIAVVLVLANRGKIRDWLDKIR